MKEFNNIISENIYKDVVIISAGPSLKKINKQKLNNFCKDKFVIAVKQAIDILDRCDMHVFNDDNYQNYSYEHLIKTPFRLYIKSGSLYKRVPKNSYDYFYSIDRTVSKKEHSLAITKDFEKYSDLFNTTKRPFGPGIMYEICIYIPMYFKSSNIHFFGWDIGSLDDDIIKRFYQKPGILTTINGLIAQISLPFYNKIYIHLENIIRLALFKMGFSLRINIPGITKGEAKFIADATLDLYKYYKKYNKQAFIYSDISLVTKKFKRSSIDYS